MKCKQFNAPRSMYQSASGALISRSQKRAGHGADLYCLVRAGADFLGSLLGGEAKLIKPKWLVDDVREAVNRMQKGYSGTT